MKGKGVKMKTLKIILCTLMIGSLFATGSVDPAYRYTSARGIGVGNAFSALVDDYSAVFVNPAAMGEHESVQLGLMQSNLFADVNLLNGAVIFPGDINYGLGFYYIGTDMPAEALFDGERFNYSNMLGYNDITLLGSVASKLSDDFSLGLTGKYRFAEAGDYNTSQANADFGVLYKVNPALKVSALYQNFLPLKVQVQGGGEGEVQQKITLGGAYRVLGRAPGSIVYSKNQKLDMSLDAEFVDQQTMLRIGIEYKPNPALAFRAGYGAEKWAVSSVNVEDKKIFSLGMGFKFSGINFDYAYSLDPNNFTDNNTHYFSVAFDLDKPEKKYTDDYMKIKSPVDKKVTYENMHRVIGTVIPKVAAVQINGVDVDVRNSRIIATVKYKDYGKQVVDIKVYDNNGDVLEQKRIRNVYLMSFYDVDKKNWARQYIEELTTLGLLRPVKPGYFMPYAFVSRAEYAKVLYSLKDLSMRDLDLSEGYRFSDVAGHPLAEYIELVAQKGMMRGTHQDKFTPDAALTREQLVAALVILEGLEVPEKALQSRFRDVSVSRWSAKYIEVAIDNGLINGYWDGTFRPKKEVTRAEFAKIVHNTSMGKKLVHDLYDWDSF